MSVILFICFLLLISTPFNYSYPLVAKEDANALLKLKQQLGEPDFLQSWVKGFNFCDGSEYVLHIGVACTSSGRVSNLRMGLLDMTVPFPDAICDLTELEFFEIFRFPGLYGPIPSCITKLTELVNIEIRYTSLVGPVPSFYNNTELTTIVLSDNRITGTIPQSLSTLPNLQYLDLASNNLTGNIPPGLLHGTPDGALTLFNNNLTGEIPKCYRRVDFMVFHVGNNRLSGDASFLFGKQKKLLVLILSNNDFEFDLSYVELPDNLEVLDISHNNIYGKVSDSFAAAARLHYPNLSFNRLCGELPQGGNMWEVRVEDVANNLCLCGSPLPPCSNSTLAPAPN